MPLKCETKWIPSHVLRAVQWFVVSPVHHLTIDYIHTLTQSRSSNENNENQYTDTRSRLHTTKCHRHNVPCVNSTNSTVYSNFPIFIIIIIIVMCNLQWALAHIAFCLITICSKLVFCSANHAIHVLYESSYSTISMQQLTSWMPYRQQCTVRIFPFLFICRLVVLHETKF